MGKSDNCNPKRRRFQQQKLDDVNLFLNSIHCILLELKKNLCNDCATRNEFVMVHVVR